MRSTRTETRFTETMVFVAASCFTVPLFAADQPAGDTGLPPDYAKSMRDYSKEKLSDLAIPAAFDWRTYNMVTPAKNQGSCGGCWSFAATGSLESKLLIHGYGTYDLSEQYQISCNTSMSGCSGGSMVSLRYWEDHGPMMESCTGFPSINGSAHACSEFSSCTQLPVTAFGYYTVNMNNRDDIKNAVLYDGPAYFRFDVYTDFRPFFNTAAAGTVYTTTAAATPTGEGHAVLIIGWSDTKQAWLLKNSWGTTAGPQKDGTFWMAYSGHAHDMSLGMANLETVLLTPTSDCTCDVGCDAVRTSAGNLDTTGAVCYEITDDIKGWTAWNIQGRTIEVNNVVVQQGDPLPPKINGKYYFGFSAGTYPWAGWTHWTW